MNIHPALIDAGVTDVCDIIPVTKETDEEAWLAARRLGLGGSDTGPLLGLSPYKGPFELWLEKTGRLAPEDISDNEAVWWGTQMEDAIARRFAMKTGYTLIDPPGTFVRRNAPVLRVNIDRFFLDDQGQLGILECKRANARLRTDWLDGQDELVPPWYQAQVAHAAATTGIHYGKVACINDNEFWIRDVNLDPDFVEQIADIELSWWGRHVADGIAPEVDAKPSTTQALARLWPTPAGSVELGDDALDLIVAYRNAHQDYVAAKEAKTEAGNRLRWMLGDNETGTYTGTPVVTFKRTSRSQFDIDEHRHRHPDCDAQYRHDEPSRTLRMKNTVEARQIIDAHTGHDDDPQAGAA